jgi:hypothetical protein
MPTAKTERWEPTPEQATYLLRFSSNSEHYIKNADDMRKQFAGKFVAIFNDNVIKSADNAGELLTFLGENYSEPERSMMFVTYVPTETEVRVA